MPSKILIFDIADSSSKDELVAEEKFALSKQKLRDFFAGEINIHNPSEVVIRILSDTRHVEYRCPVTNNSCKETLAQNLIQEYYKIVNPNPLIAQYEDMPQTLFTFPQDETDATYTYALVHQIAAKVMQNPQDEIIYYKIDADKTRLTNLTSFYCKFPKFLPPNTSFYSVNFNNTPLNTETSFNNDGNLIDKTIEKNLIYLCETIFRLKIEEIKAHKIKLTGSHLANMTSVQYSSFLGKRNPSDHSSDPQIARPISPDTEDALVQHASMLDLNAEFSDEIDRRDALPTRCPLI